MPCTRIGREEVPFSPNMDDLEEGHVVSLANEIFDSCERSSNEVLTRIELTLGVRSSGPDLRSRLASVLGLDAEAAGDARAFEGAFADLVGSEWTANTARVGFA